MSADNEITMYETPDGKIRVEVRFEDENLWLSQKLMAELFDVTVPTINEHLKNIFSKGELAEDSVIRDFRITAADGKNYNTKHYALEAIVAVGYRVNSDRGSQFRIWATERLSNYILKGYAIDSERFKHGSRFDRRYFEALLEEVREIRASERMVYQKITDIYATAADYSPNTVEAERFFATVQNRMHFAITGHTAAEIIAELQASRGRLMKMREWEDKLNAFLQFNDYEVLENKGTISRELAHKFAEKEYEEFRKTQDRNYVSDFDKIIGQLKSPEE